VFLNAVHRRILVQSSSGAGHRLGCQGVASSFHPANKLIKFVPGLRPSTGRLLAAAYLSVTWKWLPAPSLLTSVSIVILFYMAKLDDLLKSMRDNPKGVRFSDLCKVCDLYFGEPRQSGSSHRVYKTPWLGDPRVNIQNAKGKAKAYQVKQVLQAVERLEVKNG
jgi:hypothetical protein